MMELEVFIKKKNKFVFNLIVLGLFFISCSSIVKKTKEHKESYEVTTVEISPGQAKWIESFSPSLKLNKKLTRSDFELKCFKKSVSFEIVKDRIYFFISESYFSKAKTHKCYYYFKTISNAPILALDIKVVALSYPTERLQVDKKRVFLSKKDLKRVRKEQKILNRLYANELPLSLFEGPFIIPLNSKVTSYYGTRRIFNNKKRTQHLGTDLRAKVGVDIPASNMGKVVLARNLFYTGNTVILDHGLGVFTIYGHLSKFKVKAGQLINKGQILGLAGKTGRVTGPHLHWGVKVHRTLVDGMALVKNTQSMLGSKN